MARLWDEAMKKVVAASPQAFVNWLFRGGRFIELVTITALLVPLKQISLKPGDKLIALASAAKKQFQPSRL